MSTVSTTTDVTTTSAMSTTTAATAAATAAAFPGKEAVRRLYDEAVRTSLAFEDDRQRAEEAARLAHVAAVSSAQDRLLRVLLDGLDERIRAASAEGKRELEILTFQGGDVFDGDLCYLYLLVGARKPEEGVVPLIRKLSATLRPFGVKHVWKQGTVQNSLVVTWRH